MLLHSLIRTIKQPSAAVNPINQWKSIIVWSLIKDLSTGTTLGKAAFSLSDKPKFIEALIATIFNNPSIVRCSAHPLSIERGWDEHHVPPPLERGGDAMFFI